MKDAQGTVSSEPPSYEWHYAPMSGGLARKQVGAATFEPAVSMERHHELLEEFLGKCARSELKLLRTETYGHMLFNGHSGRVDVYA